MANRRWSNITYRKVLIGLIITEAPACYVGHYLSARANLETLFALSVAVSIAFG